MHLASKLGGEPAPKRARRQVEVEAEEHQVVERNAWDEEQEVKELDALQLRRYGIDGVGGGQNRSSLRRRSQTRCIPRLDAGATTGSESGNVLFCIDFARGACSDGAECSHRHDIPKFPDDEANPSVLNAEYDIFGRKRSVLLSAWEQTQRRKEPGANVLNLAALELSNIKPPTKPRSELCGGKAKPDRSVAALLDKEIRKSVGQFGDIADLRLNLERGLSKAASATVVFKGRVQAEFAKEALTGQGLLPESRELLQLKWASYTTSEVPFDLQPTKYAAIGRPAATHTYAQTTPGAADTSSPLWQKFLDADNQRYYWAHRITRQTTWLDPTSSSSNSIHDDRVDRPMTAIRDQQQHRDQPDETRHAPLEDWTPHLDPSTGATYWANEKTGQTTWIRPSPFNEEERRTVPT